MSLPKRLPFSRRRLGCDPRASRDARRALLLVFCGPECILVARLDMPHRPSVVIKAHSLAHNRRGLWDRRAAREPHGGATTYSQGDNGDPQFPSASAPSAAQAGGNAPWAQAQRGQDWFRAVDPVESSARNPPALRQARRDLRRGRKLHQADKVIHQALSVIAAAGLRPRQGPLIFRREDGRLHALFPVPESIHRGRTSK